MVFEHFAPRKKPTSKAEVPDFVLGDFKLSPGSGWIISVLETFRTKNMII
jgi:hypothetical protein